MQSVASVFENIRHYLGRIYFFGHDSLPDLLYQLRLVRTKIDNAAQLRVQETQTGVGVNRRHYIVVAHNGVPFDVFLLLVHFVQRAL